MAYETCRDVSPELWHDLKERNPEEVAGRTGAVREKGRYRLPLLDRTLLIDPDRQQVEIVGAPDRDPGFRVCLTALQYLLHVDVSALGHPISPLELTGGPTFFRGQHGVPGGPLEARFGRDAASFLAAGRRLQGEVRPAGDAALALQALPGVMVEVILWEADSEFPAQVSFTVPAHLDRFWHLDAVWGLLNLVAQELLSAAAS